MARTQGLVEQTFDSFQFILKIRKRVYSILLN